MNKQLTLFKCNIPHQIHHRQLMLINCMQHNKISSYKKEKEKKKSHKY